MATIVLKQEGTPQVSLIDGRSGSGYKLLVVDFAHASAAQQDPKAD